MGVYWGKVAQRALRETREAIRLDTGIRIPTGIGVPVASGLIVWGLTGNLLQAGLIAVFGVLLIGACLFSSKLFSVPSRMAEETAAELLRLREHRADRESNRRSQLVDRLVSEYKLSHDGLSPALLAGLELPPMDWLNERLAELGERWWIGEIHANGYNYSMFEIVPK